MNTSSVVPSPAEHFLTRIPVETAGTVVVPSRQSDFQLNSCGSLLAVCDMSGLVTIFSKLDHSFVKQAEISTGESPALRLAWSDPLNGELLAVATHHRRLCIFQQAKQGWVEIAYHESTDSIFNALEWAHPAYGLKLFACASDGLVTFMEVKQNAWSVSDFAAHESSIHALALEAVPLTKTQATKHYPMLATAGRDLAVKVWKHLNDIPGA